VLKILRITEREREIRGSGVFPDYDTNSTLTRTRKPSAAMKPSAAEKGFSDSDTTQHANAYNKPSAVEKGHSLECNATRHATKREL
jgi:hypothetical protein